MNEHTQKKKPERKREIERYQTTRTLKPLYPQTLDRITPS